MNDLSQILNLIKTCNTCWLMKNNNQLNIPLIPILPKQKAKFIFIGRDPSPRTATKVGLRGGRSVFNKEIFSITDEANIPDEDIYITNMCKCHWRTSVGTPLIGTENRSTKLPKVIAKTCIENWLIKEIDVLKPKIIFSFGEELYKLLYHYIVHPNHPPKKLSASKDKSVMDAEKYFNENGPFKIQFNSTIFNFVPLRHAGNSTRLCKNIPGDERLNSSIKSRKQVLKLLQEIRKSTQINH